MFINVCLQRLAALCRRICKDQRGAVSVELVIAIPLLMLLLLLIAQFAIWEHATHVAQAAASQALAVVRVQQAAVIDGQTEANGILEQLGSGPFRNPRIEVARDSEESTVDIHGEAASVIPFLRLPVHVRAVGPTERFVRPGNG